MMFNSHEKRAYRKAKLETALEEEAQTYKTDAEGNIMLDDNGDPEIITIKSRRKIFIPFTYNRVTSAFLDKQQAMGNFLTNAGEFIIYTNDPIEPRTNDRVIIQDQVFTINGITKEVNDSTCSMFGDNGYCLTYLTLQGGTI